MFVLISLNAVMNHLWNLCSWWEIKPWAFGVERLTPLSTDSTSLEYQRTKPREYQIVRTHTKETTWIQDLASPNHSSRTPHLNNKQNKNTSQVISRQDYHLTQLCPSEEKQTNKNPAQIVPYMNLTQTTGLTLAGQKPKGRKIQPWSLIKGDLK